MNPDTEARDLRVVVFAPMEADGALISEMLTRNGLHAIAVSDMYELGFLIDEGVGATVLTEEALHGDDLEILRAALSRQPHWSDLPLILLTTGNEARAIDTWNLVRQLGSAGNVSLLERPLRSITLSSAVEVALRSRRRQYEARRLYDDLEHMVEERTTELMSKNLELEGFTYSVSHDMRAPLRAIVSRAHMVLEDEADRVSAEGVENLRRLEGAAMKMAELIDDLLEYARIGKGELQLEAVDLAELAKEIASDMAAEKPDCSYTFAPSAGACAVCDPRLVGMALRNLFDNACKYVRPGVAAEVEFGSINLQSERVFYVRDHGIGFNMAYANKLFKPFERLHREEFSGTGIGLANVRRAIERHGGRVWAEGQPDEGSTFYFTLSAPPLNRE